MAHERDVTEDINEEHQNMWNYVYFLAHLNKKSPAEYNGAESMISKQIGLMDTSWMPANMSYLQQAIMNQQASSDEGDAIGDLQRDVTALRTMVQQLTEKLQL